MPLRLRPRRLPSPQRGGTLDRALGRTVWRVQAITCLVVGLWFFGFARSLWAPSADLLWLVPFGLSVGFGGLCLALAVRFYRKQNLSDWLDEQ